MARLHHHRFSPRHPSKARNRLHSKTRHRLHSKRSRLLRRKTRNRLHSKTRRQPPIRILPQFLPTATASVVEKRLKSTTEPRQMSE